MEEKLETISLADARESTFNFAQKIFIYYMLFSVFGFYSEIFWAEFVHLGTAKPFSDPILQTIIPMASPYGLGAIAVILIVWPLIKKNKINPALVLILNIIITGAVEFVCAAVLVIFSGHNYFWNYSAKLLNLNGFVCLESALIFGVLATLFIYLFYPFIEKFMQRFNTRQINAVFWILITFYILDLLYSYA
ncbi:MAG: putative ABC transporter permease [Clostridia bacterium]|jgi:uncharacterized membrane protein